MAMLGILLNKEETKEMQYIIKRELEELLYELKDDKMDPMVKTVMEERYQILFSLFQRVAPARECFRYIRPNRNPKNKPY